MSTESTASPSVEELLQRVEGIADSWKQAEKPFSDSDFDSDDALAVLHAVGALAVHEIQVLAKALREAQEPAPTAWPGDGAAKSGSVAEIYVSSPFAPIVRETLDHRPGEHTSEDFQRGYFAALMVSEIRGAAALEKFGQSEWEYGWRSFFPNGEEYEWLPSYSREVAEQEILDFQKDEDARFADKEDSEGKLTYSLWRRRKSEAGPWERVTDGSDS